MIIKFALILLKISISEFKKFNATENKISIIKSESDNVILRCYSDDNTFLVFVDSYYPGWHAYIGGQEVDIFKANGLFKGIFVPKGNHIIEFKFIPKNYKIYLLISIITFISLMITSIALFIIDKKKNNYVKI